MYRARLWGTDVAVKTLKPDPDAVTDFLHEVHLLSQLRHPNVVLYLGAAVGESEEDDRVLYIVTEFMGGGTLAGLLYSSTELVDMQVALRMAYEAALGIAYLHSRNPPIVHRDIKSENLLLDESGVIKVADFGLSAISAASGAQMTDTAGSRPWMAPEMQVGLPYDTSVDAYSFGVLLSELITRVLPYRDVVEDGTFPDLKSALARVVDGDLRPSLPDGLPPPLKDLVQSCLSQSGHDRPSMGTIVSRLRALKTSRVVGSADVARIFYWLSQRDLRLQETGLRQVAWLPLDTLKDVQSHSRVMAMLTSLVWKTPPSSPTLLYYLFVALERLVRNPATLASFVESDEEGPALVVSRLADAPPAVAHVLLSLLVRIASSSESGRVAIQEALLEFNLLRTLFLLEPTVPTASSLLNVLNSQQQPSRPQHPPPTSSAAVDPPPGTPDRLGLAPLLTLLSDNVNRIDSSDADAVAHAASLLRTALAGMEALAVTGAPSTPSASNDAAHSTSTRASALPPHMAAASTPSPLARRLSLPSLDHTPPRS